VSPSRGQLAAVARVATKLGVIGFGGPAAHVAMLRSEVVERRAWLTDAEFLDLFAATTALPGPGSTQMVIAVGRRQAGWTGMVVAGTCFVAPAATSVLVLAGLYVRFHRVPAVAGLLYGVKPVVVAVIAVSLWGLSRGVAAAGALGLVVAGAAGAAFLAGVDPLVALAIGAVVVMLWRNRTAVDGGAATAVVPGVALALAGHAARRPSAPVTRHVGLWPLAREFAKLGVIVFGSGYVLLAFLQRDLVHQLHWLGSKQLLDAVAAGQVTPGPVFTTATFVGYLVSGVPGAVVATLAIFLPSFLMVAALMPVLARARRSSWVSGALDGAAAAAVGLMAGVAVTLARSGLTDALTAAVGVAALVSLARFRVNTVWVVIAGGVVGVLHSL